MSMKDKLKKMMPKAPAPEEITAGTIEAKEKPKEEARVDDEEIAAAVKDFEKYQGIVQLESPADTTIATLLFAVYAELRAIRGNRKKGD